MVTTTPPSTTSTGPTGTTIEPAALPAGYTKELTIGRMVHFVLDTGPSAGEHRPAVVVRVWNKEQGYVQLQVFTDGSNDGFTENVIWRTSVRPDPSGQAAYSWHWIEKAE